MAKNDWTVVSETPATEASSWTVVSETPVGPVDYKKLESTGAEPVDYSAAATAMEGTPAGERERKVYTGSIFDTIKLPEPQFDPVEAARLSRKSEAEKTVGLLAPRPRTQVAAPIPPEQLQRTTGEAIKDSVIDILQGSAGLGKSITANLLAGDNPLTEFFESSIEAGERAKSPFLRNQAAKRAALIQNIAREQGELAAARAVFQQSFTPAGASVIFQGGGSLVPTLGMSLAGLSLKALTATNMLATAGESAQQTAQALTRIPPEQWSKNDVYQDLRSKGLSHPDAVKILAPLYALPSQATGLVTGAISGSTGLERALAGTAARGARARLGRAGAELAGEEPETLGPKAAENIARAMAGEDIGITAGMGQAAAETAMGSVPGSALAAAITGPGAAPRIPSAAQIARERGFGAEQWKVVSEEPTAPAAAPTVRAEIPEQQRAVEELEREMEREEPIEVPVAEVTEVPALEAPAAEPVVTEPTEPSTEPLEIEPLPEQLAGEPMPKTPEVVDAERILDEMYAERDKIEEQKIGSLWAKVKGRLADSDVKDLGDKKRYTFLRAGKQKAPITIADMVADGTLDAWLPFDMRHDAPNFDGQVSEEYIKDKLRNGDYTNFERRMAIDQIMDQAESYERLINEEFTLEEINREIQLAVDEQRQIDQALEEPAAQRPAAPVVSRAEVEEFLKAPTEAGLRQEAEMRARAEREAARVEAAPPPEEFTLTGSERAADEAAARGQRELEAEPEQPPLLDVTGQPEMKGRHPQVVAAGRLFKEGKMAREDFEKYVDYYTPIREVEADKLYEPASEERIREALREGDKPFLGVPIADGTRVGLRMDIPSLRKGVPVVSIHEGKENVNPKTGEPYKSAGKRISYGPTAYIKDVFFAPRDQYKSLEMGIQPAKEPLQTVEGKWVNMAPAEVAAKVKELMSQPGWTQVGFDPARHGYFYDRKTKRPVVRASEMFQIGNFLLAKDVEYAPKEQFLYSIEPGRSMIGLYSVLEDSIGKLNIKSSTPAGWKDAIKGLLNKGTVKQDEVEWTGINDWLDLQSGKVSKEQVMDYLRENGVQVEETVLGGEGREQAWVVVMPWDTSEPFGSEEEANRWREETIEGYVREEGRDREELEESFTVRRVDGEAPEGFAKYGQYALPGGENYREVLLTLPEKKNPPVDGGKSAATMLFERDMMEKYGGDSFPSVYGRLNGNEIDKYEMLVREDRNSAKSESMAQDRRNNYRSSHWDQFNVIAHIRVNDRTDADGKRVLFVEELQSDWGQEGKREGFRKGGLTDAEYQELVHLRHKEQYGGLLTNEERRRGEDLSEKANGSIGLPTAPFVTKTEGWLNLALKRVMVMAAEGGYDKVAFVTGEQSADRYDLSKQVESVEANKRPSGKWSLMVDGKNGEPIFSGDVAESELEDYVGKELAQKIVSDGGGTYTGLDLKVGGEGMKAFYDKIVPTAVKKLLPKVGGGQMGTVSIGRSVREQIAEQGIPWTSLLREGQQPEPGYRERIRFEQKYAQPGFTITDAMRESVAEGLPLFHLRLSPSEPVTGSEQTRTPSLTRRVKTLSRQREDGRITDEQFVKGVDEAIQQNEEAKLAKPVSERVRGADYIRQRLLEAKRRGDLTSEAVDFAEWFIRNNEALVDDLGITVRAPSERATAGMYNPLSRIMVLLKEAAGDTTVVHEILHHLERMMPAEVQGAIRKEWLGRFLRAKRAAKTPTEKLYFELLMNHHFGSGAASDVKLPAGMRQPIVPLEGSSYQIAIDMLRMNRVPVADYQYVNPSEFWAVNGTDIMQGRFNAIRGGVLARLKQWLKELGQKIKSIFGLRSDAPLIKALDSLAKGDGKFVSKDMLMDGDTFLQIGKNVYGERPLVNWTSPDETKLDNFIYKLQDKYIDTKRVVQDIERSIGAIDDKWNPYLQEELYHGRTATQTKDFLRYEVRPLLEAMKAENVTIGEFEEFLHNRFAPTRNDNIAKINPEMPDGGSGIFTEDAEAYMAALTPEQRRKYERLAGMVDDITKGTRDYLVQTGLEQKETIDGWESSSPNYVPLNREDVDYSLTVGTGTGRGFSVRGPSTRRATGSLRPVANVLANLVMQRERAIVRGEKNRVAVALYGLAVQNANPKFWLAVNPEATKGRKALMDELVNMGLTQEDAEGLMQEPSQKVVDPRTGLVMTRVNPVLRGANNVVAARVNGKDRFVFFNTQDPRAARMAEAILNMDADQLGTAMSLIAKVTRFLSSINTQYNPVFGIYNFLRDYQGGAIQLSGTPLEDSRWEVLNPQNVLGAMRGIYQTLRTDRAEGMQLMTPWSQLWIEFQGEGGQTGYRDMFSRSQERADALNSELKRLNEGPVKKVGLAAPRAVLNWLSDYNETLENAIRLTAYKAALDKGLSKEKAASVAKNLTVNFNRKGQIGVQAGALYSFFNSAVQGTTRLLQTVVKAEKPGDFKSLHLTKAGKVIVYGGLLAGTMQAVMMAAMGFDEKEPPDFVKDRNFILPIGDGKYLAWPLPLGYHVIPAIGRIVAEWALSGFKDTTKRVVHLTDLILDAFNPIGNAGLSMQSVLPTILDPAAAIFENRDWTGKPIAKEDFNKLDPTPGYTRAKQNASWVGEQVSYFLNSITGGNADKPGAISPTPDQIDYLIGQATGGLGREILKATKTIKAGVTGEELPPYNIPLVGRFYGNTKAGYAEAQRFYDNLQELNVLQNQLEGKRKRNENPAEFIKENPKVRLAAAANAVQRNIQNLRKQRDALIEKGAPKERVQAVENNIKVQMQRFNEKLRQLEEATKSKKEPVAAE